MQRTVTGRFALCHPGSAPAPSRGVWETVPEGLQVSSLVASCYRLLETHIRPNVRPLVWTTVIRIRGSHSRTTFGRRGYPVASGRQRFSIISDGLPTQLPDIDPDETREWIDSFDTVTRTRGRGRSRYLMLRLLERAREQQVGVPGLRSTDYINTIPPAREPWFPGDEHVERRIRAYIRWR